MANVTDQPVRLVTTAEAAAALSVHPVTLRRWMHEGLVRPASKTAKGHARWNIEDLRAQVAKLTGQN